MYSGLLDLFAAINGSMTIIEWLNASTYDELVEIDIPANRYHIKQYIYDKSANASSQGVYTDLYRFTLENLVHPDDRAAYALFMNPETILERLENEDSKGVLITQLRFELQGGIWHWVELCVVGGPAHELPIGTIRLYTYDYQEQYKRRGQIEVANSPNAQPYRERKTGLLWERAFFDKAEELLAVIDAENWCVIAIDIEHFSLFNDWYNRTMGDLLLSSIGKELAVAEESADGLAGYLGQDDFCFVAPYDEDRIVNLYNRISGQITKLTTAIGFKPLFGISMLDNGIPFLDLFDRAKMALGYAREDFKTDICLYEPSMREKDAKEYRTLLEFQRAIREDEFIVYLQPQCRISTGKIIGIEALTRWRKPDGTIVSPGEFIPVLEKHGFITDLDCFIWDKVCRQLRNWIDGGHKPVPVSVNVSQNDFYTIDVAEHFEHLSKKYGIETSLLKIEITESAFADDASSVQDVIARLRAQGFTVLMDDFGSGYSSLNRLSSLNVDVIKLDAGFFRMKDEDKHKSIHIVETIINMAKTMALPIICEGVETKEQIDFLESLGCRYVQGYYYYRPMSSPEFEELIGDGSIIDDLGFVTKHNSQLQLREFLDQNIYSDAMLNHILGPVAYYLWHEDAIDIVRFNEQFYEAVGVSNFDDRIVSIQQYAPYGDEEKLFDLFKRATEDTLNGASDVIGFYRPDGSLTRFLMHLYYLGESSEGKRFYGSVRDVTEVAELQIQLKMLSYRLPLSVLFMRRMQDRWKLTVVIHGLADKTGISQEELQRGLDDKSLFDHIDQDDFERLRTIAQTSIQSSSDFFYTLCIENGRGETTRLRLEADRVEDNVGDASYILKLTVV